MKSITFNYISVCVRTVCKNCISLKLVVFVRLRNSLFSVILYELVYL